MTTVAPPRAALIKTPAWARRRRFDRVRRGSDRGFDSRRRSPVASASSSSDRSNLAASNLRELLAGDEILRAPCAHDALTAALIERAGFKVGFMSGFCVSAARLAMPDAGLISYGEMEDVGRHITQATSAGFPFIGDADDGYGNAMNAKRTVRGYARAGFAGILMEDQLAPKACGHTKPRCLGRDEAVARVRAAQRVQPGKPHSVRRISVRSSLLPQDGTPLTAETTVVSGPISGPIRAATAPRSVVFVAMMT